MIMLMIGAWAAVAVGGCGGADSPLPMTESRTLTSLSLTPDSVSLATGASQLFRVEAIWSDGSTIQPMTTWSVTGGTVSSDGVYAAGDSTGSYWVIVTAGELSDTAVVQVVPRSEGPHLDSIPSAGGPGIPDLGVNASLNGWRPFPADNPWNTPIDTAPVDPNSAAIIARMGADFGLHPDWGFPPYNNPAYGIPYVVVSGKQPKATVIFTAYAAESDPGPYPIPSNAPIEGTASSKGDRHVIVLDRDNQLLYELNRAFPQSGGSWHANSGAIFDLRTNALRPAGWTSADAAGLPIFPGLVRYDEVTAGEIRHALRFTVGSTRKAYVHPARHAASWITDPTYPPMGMRVRLRKSFDTSGFAPQTRVLLEALKKYGMILADNGGNWMISGITDSRWDERMLDDLQQVKGSDFEVVRMDTIVVPP